jgi:hypothetical protein
MANSLNNSTMEQLRRARYDFRNCLAIMGDTYGFKNLSTVGEQPSSSGNPLEVDQDIMSLHAEGWSIRAIAQATYMSHPRVRAVIAAHVEGLELSHINGAPREVTPEIEQLIAVSDLQS